MQTSRGAPPAFRYLVDDVLGNEFARVPFGGPTIYLTLALSCAHRAIVRGRGSRTTQETLALDAARGDGCLHAA